MPMYSTSKVGPKVLSLFCEAIRVLKNTIKWLLLKYYLIQINTCTFIPDTGRQTSLQNLTPL